MSLTRDIARLRAKVARLSMKPTDPLTIRALDMAVEVLGQALTAQRLADNERRINEEIDYWKQFL